MALRRAVGLPASAVRRNEVQAVTEAQLFEALGSSVPAYYVAVSLNGQVLSMNPVMREALGYRLDEVLLASNGWEGVELFKARHGEIDLVILDMMMPVLGGRQAFELMNEIDATVPVVLASGLTKDDDFEEMTRLGLRGFVRKPHRLSDLSRVVAGLVKSQPMT